MKRKLSMLVPMVPWHDEEGDEDVAQTDSEKIIGVLAYYIDRMNRWEFTGEKEKVEGLEAGWNSLSLTFPEEAKKAKEMEYSDPNSFSGKMKEKARVDKK